jgi:cytochrome c553
MRRVGKAHAGARTIEVWMCRNRQRAWLVAIAAFCGLAVASVDSGRAEPIEEKAQLCNQCHGENGVPIEKTAPVIWGQKHGYLYIQLRDFKQGTRHDDIMSPIASTLTRDEMMALAEYFSQKPWPDLGQPPAPKDVVEEALRTNSSVGCTGCHLDKFQGDGTVPRLAGQKETYLAQEMEDFRSHERANNPGMSDLMNAASPKGLDALARYLAGL